MTTETTGTTSTTSTTSTTNTTAITEFTLPRSDWFDSDGRIYKDVIIENLNACEQKLIELANLDAFEINLPDMSTISITDTTLTSEENSIVNLKSFLTITGLTFYPIELNIVGTTIKKIGYWNNSYKYIIKNNIETNATDTDKYVFYNFSNDTARSSSSPSIGSNEEFIGMYNNGTIVGLNANEYINMNIRCLLANMSRDVVHFSVAHGVNSTVVNPKNNTRTVAFIRPVESKSGLATGQQATTDYGRD